MDKKSGNLFLSIFVLVLIVFWLIYFLDLYPRLKQARLKLDSYLLAETCQDSSSCRKIFQAKTLQVKQERSKTGYAYSRDFFNNYHPIIYKLNLKPNNFKVQKIIILTEVDFEGEDFGISNLYIPSGDYIFEYLEGAVFPVGETLKLELWNDVPTLLYVVRTDVANNGYCEDEECAIPTLDNPIIQYWLIKNKFDALAISVMTISLFFLVVILIKLVWILKMERMQ
ncbi:MAG: hypothetical protein U0V02_18160 [Anaerolineales bacterium]